MGTSHSARTSVHTSVALVMNVSKLRAAIAASFLLFAAGPAVCGDEDIGNVVACRQLAACRAATGLKEFADSIDAGVAKAKSATQWLNANPSTATTDAEIRSRSLDERKKLAAQCISGHSNIDSVCEASYLTDKEIEQKHPTPPRVELGAQSKKDYLSKEDDALYTRLSNSCGGTKLSAAEDCGSLIGELNDVESELAKDRKDPAFAKVYPNGIVIRSAGLASSLGMSRAADGRWDTAHPAKKPGVTPIEEAATDTAQPRPALPAVNIAELSVGCRKIVADGYGVNVDEHVAKFNDMVMKQPMAQAQPGDLKRWVADINSKPFQADDGYFPQYEACIYQARLRQLGIAQADAPGDNILKRGHNASAAVLQAGFDQEKQWNAERPQREAKAKEDARLAEERDRKYKEDEARRQARAERDAARPHTDWSGAINVLAGALGAALSQGQSQADGTQGSGSDCIGTPEQCAELHAHH